MGTREEHYKAGVQPQNVAAATSRAPGRATKCRQHACRPERRDANRLDGLRLSMLPIPETLEPMEAKPVTKLPAGDGWLYEPKWDGYRCLAFRDGQHVSLFSKRGTNLNRYFPELVTGLSWLKPKRFVLDGEILVVIDGRPDFDSLQLRMHPAESRVTKLAADTPSTFMAFDLLADAKKDLRSLPLSDRREALEHFTLTAGSSPFLMLSPATASLDTANSWLELAGQGLDGVMAKRLDDHYQPGKRAMQKFKLWKSIDAVVGAIYEDARGHVEHLLLGLYDAAGKLNYVGRCPPPGTEAEIRKQLEPAMGGTGFTGRKPQPVNRWSGKRHKAIMLKPKLVLEASADHVAGGRMRHGSRFIRWRPDKKPSQCSMDQVERG
jgi:ATP-dependent DNA ligase